MFLVDTNVFLPAADEDAPEHARAIALLESWRHSSTSWCTSWPVVYEFLRVVTHPRVLVRPWKLQRAWTFVEALLASPGFSILIPTPRHSRIAVELFAQMPSLRGSILHDVHTVVLMREHGISRIYTRDRGFRQFDFLDVRDPLP